MRMKTLEISMYIMDNIYISMLYYVILLYFYHAEVMQPEICVTY